MFEVEIMTVKDKLRGQSNPVVMPRIKTVSVTGGRYLLTDDAMHMYMFRPEELAYMTIYNMKEVE